MGGLEWQLLERDSNVPVDNFASLVARFGASVDNSEVGAKCTAVVAGVR